jgi:serine/threonine protein kinase
MPDDISENAQDLLRRILVVDPSERLTVSDQGGVDGDEG